jgi:hypothetical protein
MKANRNVLSAVTMFVLLAVSPAAFGREEKPSALGKTSRRVFEEFARINSISDAHQYLQTARPPCIPAPVRAELIARLPYEGSVEADSEGRLKLKAIDSVLEYHGRKGVLEVKVIHVVQAFIGLHARSVLLISERALDLLSAEELRAAVAHEIGHEYFWKEYQAAKMLRDPGKLQEVELRCDAIAVLTLLQLSHDPADLLAGVSRQAGFNELVGADGNANCYVSMKERGRFIRALIDRIVTASDRPVELSAGTADQPR